MPVPEPSKPARNLDEIRRMRDPIAQARAADEFLAYAESRAKAARGLRADALRAARAAGFSRPQIAARAGINVHTVKALTR